MAKTYYTVLTTYGAQLFAQAMANRQQVRITQFAVGDGNGRAVQPDSARTSLVRQVHRANISAVSPDPRNNKQVIFELTIPENVGGFWIREMGIYDNNNRLVAYANCPDTYKPRLDEGSGKVQVMRMILLVSSSNAVTLSVDDSVIFVTRGQLTPKTITATSQNGVDETGHSHQIDQASTTRKGITQLTNDTGLDSETLALTAKAGKALAQQIAQNQQGIAGLNSGKVDKTAISNSVSSTSQTTIASSQAVKTAYDKCVEAKNAADAAQRTANAKQSPATTLAGYGITDSIQIINQIYNSGSADDLLGQNKLVPINGASRDRLGFVGGMYNFGLLASLSAGQAKALLYAPHSVGQLWIKNVYGSSAFPWKRVDGADWSEIRNPVNASTTRRGLAQYTDNVNFDSSDWGASAKALRTVNLKAVAAKEAADSANNNANGRVSKSGDTMTGHLQIKNGDWSSVRLFNSEQKFLILEVQPDTQGGSFGALIYRDAQGRNLARLTLPQKDGTLALEGETVRKSGDTMTGALEIDRADSFVRGKQAGVNKWFVGKGSASSDDVALHNYVYNYGITLKSDKIETTKPFYVGNNRVAHAGDDYMYLTSTNYGGIAIQRPSRNDKMIIESHGDGFAFIRRNSTNNNNHYVIYTPNKSGTLLLEGDLASKTKSLVSRRDYSRTVNGTHPNHRNQQVTVSGSVHIYPDGRIVQIFNLQNLSFNWFGRDGEHSQARSIPLQLWTAMPNTILDVNAKPLRAITPNSTEYGLEAGEWVTGWSLYRQGIHKDRVQIDCNRLEGSAGELVNLYVVVEGY